MSQSQKSNKYIRDWCSPEQGKHFAAAEQGVYESKNIAVFVAMIFSLLSNLLSVVCFLVGGVDLGLVFVGAMLVCDVIFLVLFTKINFCCQYSAGLVALYLAINVLLTVASLLWGSGVFGDGSMFTVFGIILRCIAFVVFFVVLLLSVHTARTTKHAVSISVLLSVLLLGGLVYGQLFGGGFYGQEYSVLNGERTVVYALRTTDDGEEYYVAKDVLPGLGTKVVVADTYMDKEVRSVSVNVLAAPRLQSVVLTGERVMDVAGKNDMAADVKLPNITVERQLVEQYRQNAFKDGAIGLRDTLAAAYMPALEEGEVAVRFQYDTAQIAPELYNADNILPVLILQAGERVETTDFPALMQNYYTQENILEWSYENAYGWNLLGMSVGGEDLFASAITKNTDVQVSFERVKKVRFALADAEYYVPTNFDEIGYVSPSAAEVELDYNNREGCYVSMSTMFDGYVGGEKRAFHDVATLREMMFSGDFEEINSIVADVEYTMNVPSISQFSVTVAGKAVGEYVYGDQFVANYAAEAGGAIVTYSLKETRDLADEWNIVHALQAAENYSVGVRTPGEVYFELVARADDVYGNKEIFAENSQIVSIDVEKKTITGVWDLSDLPAQYDSLTHSVSYSIDASQAVTQNGAASPDALTFTTTATDAQDAGSYTFTATLDENLLDKYVLAGHTASHTIARKVVDVSWDTTEFVYDGEEHVPMASWTLADGSPITQFDIGKTDANVGGGKYTATVRITDENHIFASGETTSTQYVILPKTLTMTDGDWQDLSFVYCNQSQKPTAGVATGTKDGTLILDVDNQNAINVGSYTATASTSNTNYTLDGVTTKGFAITKATAAVEWSNLSLVFNGNAQKPTATYRTFNTSGEQTTVATAQVTATGESINVDNYTATASHASTLDAQNYTLTNTTSGFDITKKTVSAVWGSTTFTFSGEAQAPTATYKNVKNQTVSLTVSGEQVNAGSDYTAIASLKDSLEQQNYTLDNTTATFKINQKSVSATWTTSTFTYDGTEKTVTASYKDVTGATVALTVASNARVNAGTQTATATLTTALEQQNYTLTGGSTTLKINAKSVAVQWSNLTVVYNGTQQMPLASFQDVFGSAKSMSVDKGLTNAGSTTVTASYNDGNYTFTGTSNTFTVTAYTVTSITWTGDTSFTYNGSAQGPTATYQKLDGSTATAYTPSQVNAGSYTATAATNDTNYQFASTAEKTKAFTISKASIAVSWTNTSFTYNGKSQVPTASATGVKGETVSVTVSGAQTNAGSHTATASTNNQNYTLTNSTCSFTIAKKQVSVASWSNLSQEYTGAALKPTATCSDSGVTLVVNGSLTNAGTTTVSATLAESDKKNYELVGETQTTFTVTAKKITVSWSGNRFEADGTAKAPTATYQGVVITVSVAAQAGSSLTGGNAVNAGSYTATASTSNQNYEIVNASFSFTIVAPQGNDQ